jgi:hypothetical protein
MATDGRRPEADARDQLRARFRLARKPELRSRSVRDLTVDTIKRGSKVASLAVEIADDAGKVLDTIKARELFD